MSVSEQQVGNSLSQSNIFFSSSHLGPVEPLRRAGRARPELAGNEIARGVSDELLVYLRAGSVRRREELLKAGDSETKAAQGEGRQRENRREEVEAEVGSFTFLSVSRGHFCRTEMLEMPCAFRAGVSLLKKRLVGRTGGWGGVPVSSF